MSRSHRIEWALLSFHSVCLSVGHSMTYSLPRLIDHNQIWSDPCKPFWIPCLPYFGCQREKYAKFCLFPTRILATANVMHRAIWLVYEYFHPATYLTVCQSKILNLVEGREEVKVLQDGQHRRWREGLRRKGKERGGKKGKACNGLGRREEVREAIDCHLYTIVYSQIMVN